MMAVLYLARADFLERARRFSFLVLIALALFLGYSVLNGFFILRLDSYRGVYNAAWIGTLTAVTLAFFLSLAGFYLVRGNVQQDRALGVGQILAATPLRRSAYVAGKFASSAALLLLVTGVLALAALAMLLIHGEDKTVDLAALLLPFLFFAVPVALLAAATAVFFDCTPWLREPAGNVIYFFLWAVSIPLVGTELFGFGALEREMVPVLQVVAPEYGGGVALGAGSLSPAQLETFLWTGFAWEGLIGSRLLFVLAALLLAAAAVLPFDRFDPARARAGKARRAFRLPAGWERRFTGWVRRPTAVTAAPITSAAALTPASAGNGWTLPARLVAAELRLLLKGQPWWWYLGLAGLVVAQLNSTPDGLQRWLLPLAWLWPLLRWSQLGARERLFGTAPLLRSAPGIAVRQPLAAWAAGVLLALIAGSGALLRFLAEPALLPGFVAGALFIPSLALLLGTVSGSERPLQIALLLWWYLGPLNGLVPLDITGATASGLAHGIPWFYLAASPLLLGLALLARRRSGD